MALASDPTLGSLPRQILILKALFLQDLVNGPGGQRARYALFPQLLSDQEGTSGGEPDPVPGEGSGEGFIVKKTPLSAFSRPRSNGIIAVDLRGDDALVDVAVTDGSRDIMLLASSGKAIRFRESDVRAMGRGAAGVRGIRLGEGERVISLIIVDEGDILTATENGYGKRTPLADFRAQKRGGKGVISIKTTKRNGPVVGILLVSEDDDLMLMTNIGKVIRMQVNSISVISRNTQGVKLMGMDADERVAGAARLAEKEE